MSSPAPPAPRRRLGPLAAVAAALLLFGPGTPAATAAPRPSSCAQALTELLDQGWPAGLKPRPGIPPGPRTVGLRARVKRDGTLGRVDLVRWSRDIEFDRTVLAVIARIAAAPATRRALTQACTRPSTVVVRFTRDPTLPPRRAAAAAAAPAASGPTAAASEAQALVARAEKELAGRHRTRAARLYRRALRTAAGRERIPALLGLARLEMETRSRRRPALERLGEVLALAPDHGEALFLLGQAHDLHGARLDALEAYARYLDTHPRGRWAARARARVEVLQRALALGQAVRRKAGRPRAEAPGTPASLGACRVSADALCYSPRGQCDERLIALLGRARRRLRVAIYALNHPRIVEALLAARARGVDVRVIVDRGQRKQPYARPQVARLLAAGIPLRQNTRTRIMHVKSAIVDDRWVSLGSFNYTTAAAAKNDEVLTVLDCPGWARDMTRWFEDRWRSFRPVTE